MIVNAQETHTSFNTSRAVDETVLGPVFLIDAESP